MLLALHSTVRTRIHPSPSASEKLTDAMIENDYVFDHSDLNFENGLPAGLKFHLLMNQHRSTVSLYKELVDFINNSCLDGHESQTPMPSLYENQKQLAAMFKVRPRQIVVCKGGCRAFPNWPDDADDLDENNECSNCRNKGLWFHYSLFA